MSNESEKEKILHYLSEAYCGARKVDDDDVQLRLARAIAAFTADTKEAIFVDSFIQGTSIVE